VKVGEKVRIKLKDVNQFNELLIRKGFTKSAFAEEIKLSVPMTIQISNGDRGPGTKLAQRILEVLQVTFDDLFIIERTIKTPIAQ
jgi:DNA-binding XRE family transcriptional regulator